MQKMKPFRFVLFLAIFICVSNSLRAQPTLGDAPRAPKDFSGLPGGGPHLQIVTGSFNVDTSSREQVREFYNTIYTSSDGIPINSTAVTSNCIPGTNSTMFVSVTLRRINWFRALAGIPAAVTFDAGESTKDQAAALMMSEHNALQHVGDWTGWDRFSTAGTSASANSNLALGNNGPDAITAYILDFGANNSAVGHRRWILYPQTQAMGTGDVPRQNSYNSANATWVFDANYGGPRPATRTPYVAWPPAGYVPYQVVYPQWSFALSNANLSAATVSMTSNGVAVAVTQQSYVTGYGENTLVWYPTSLGPATTAVFPFSGTDTVYAITINNVVTAAGTKVFTYNVTVFDPATTGADYFPLTVSGSSQPVVNVGNPYRCTPATNPNITGYQWLTAQATNGNLVDNALNGTTNFIVSPVPAYPIVTNPPVGSGKCFHLAHGDPVPQLLQFKEHLFPTNTTTVSFKSLLGYASTDEIARVQISINGGTSWQDIYTQTGNGSAESIFITHTLSLSGYAGKETLLRFNYDFPFSFGSYYAQIDPHYGWCIENIVVTNTQQLVHFATNSTSSTNFTFTPMQTGNYVLQARGVIFNEFPLDSGTVKQVTAIVGPPVITLSAPIISGSQVKINFTLASGLASTFHLLEVNQLGGTWATNASAVLTTNIPGSSYQFTTTNGLVTRFYRVQTP